jgi:hypothetical protein
MKSLLALAFAMVVATAGCGHSTGMSGPSMNSHMDDEAPPPSIQSNDIMQRDAVTSKAKVQHILVSWKDLSKAFGDHMDPRGAARTREEADKLAVDLLKRVRAGEPMEALMKEFSEDQGSAATGMVYTVEAKSEYVFEFKRMALRLNVGEAGMVLSQFGWHIMKRVE